MKKVRTSAWAYTKYLFGLSEVRKSHGSASTLHFLICFNRLCAWSSDPKEVAMDVRGVAYYPQVRYSHTSRPALVLGHATFLPTYLHRRVTRGVRRRTSRTPTAPAGVVCPAARGERGGLIGPGRAVSQPF